LAQGEACKPKKSIRQDRFFSVEPRGIGPLYPSVDHGFLTRGGPSSSTKISYQCLKIKESPRKSRTFGATTESVVDIS
jgi:hypothetical protein